MTQSKTPALDRGAELELCSCRIPFPLITFKWAIRGLLLPDYTNSLWFSYLLLCEMSPSLTFTESAVLSHFGPKNGHWLLQDETLLVAPSVRVRLLSVGCRACGHAASAPRRQLKAHSGLDTSVGGEAGCVGVWGVLVKG